MGHAIACYGTCVNVRGHLLGVSSFLSLFCKAVLVVSTTWPCTLNQLAHQLPGESLSPPPISPWERARDTDACHHILLLMWVPGPEPRRPGSQGKCFYCWAIFPAPGSLLYAQHCWVFHVWSRQHPFRKGSIRFHSTGCFKKLFHSHIPIAVRTVSNTLYIF